MEKVFEALKFIFGEALFSEYKDETHNRVRECNSIVYKALTELKDIKEAKPSEALEELEELRDFRYGENKLLVCQTEMYTTIKHSLLKAQAQEKENAEYKEALRIIFEKNVNIKALKHYLESYDNDLALKLYNSNVNKDEQLTQEEFDTLKRWCEK